MDPVEPVTYTASTSASTSSGVPTVGFDVISPIVSALSGSDIGFFTLGGLLGVLNSIWSVFAIFAYIVATVLIGLYVYASVHKKLYEDLQEQGLRDAEQLFDEQFRGVAKNSRLTDVFTHADSDNPNDWKLAIIEADIILDDILKQRGYAGNSLGERLKSISPQQLSTLNDAWEAHKVRNRIAHDGADFVLTHRMAHETIARYQRVFAEFGVT
tara:strand:- start:3130 stop:3768 length:639 start_codon:yes stop_codon:yes gene_type:complete